MSNLPNRTLDAVTKGPENITSTETGMVMASGPEAVDLVRLMVIRSSLALEIKTGMKMSRLSALAAANAALSTKYRRKQQALNHLNGLLSALEVDDEQV